MVSVEVSMQRSSTNMRSNKTKLSYENRRWVNENRMIDFEKDWTRGSWKDGDGMTGEHEVTENVIGSVTGGLTWSRMKEMSVMSMQIEVKHSASTVANLCKTSRDHQRMKKLHVNHQHHSMLVVYVVECRASCVYRGP